MKMVVWNCRTIEINIFLLVYFKKTDGNDTCECWRANDYPPTRCKLIFFSKTFWSRCQQHLIEKKNFDWLVNELSTKEEDSTFNFVPPTIFCFCIWLDVKACYRLPRSSPQRHINESVASTSLLFWCHRFPNNPPPLRSGQLKRDFNWSIRCVRKILQQEM